MTEVSAAQYQVQPADLLRRKAFRYYVAGWFEDETGKKPYLVDVVETADPVAEGDFAQFLIAKAARIGRTPKAGAEIQVKQAFALLSVPRPPESDPRPLLSWAVRIYFVCHDVKFGGYGNGIFAWPEKPEGRPLDLMMALLMSDELATRGDGPDGHKYCDLDSVTVIPSAEAPTYL